MNDLVTLFGTNVDTTNLENLREEFGYKAVATYENHARLSIEQSKFSIVDADKKATPILTKTGSPAPDFDVIIIDFNEHRNRTWNDTPYTKGVARKPLCWSHDGKTPATNATSPQASSCDACPRNAKNADMKCSASRRLAVLDVANIDSKPMLLNVPITGDWAKESLHSEFKNYAFTQYRQVLSGVNGGIPVQAVVTKLLFDASGERTSLRFHPVRPATTAELDIVKKHKDSDTVNRILGKYERKEDATVDAPVNNKTVALPEDTSTNVEPKPDSINDAMDKLGF